MAWSFLVSKLTDDLQNLFIQKKWTLTIAESCTGGLVSSQLTRRAGSSAYFLGSVVSYANSVKTKLLSVDDALLKKWGAVSEPVALAMAQNLRKSLGSSWSLGVTGIAGPTGGSKEKPVGTVWIALASADGSLDARKFNCGNDRATIREWAAKCALGMLRFKLEGITARLLREQPS